MADALAVTGFAAGALAVAALGVVTLGFAVGFDLGTGPEAFSEPAGATTSLGTAAFFAGAALLAAAFGAGGTTSEADEPVMRPAATWVRTRSASGTGTTGVSTAGFSARAALTIRLARLDCRAAGAFRV